jgi:hypothetical protein
MKLVSAVFLLSLATAAAQQVQPSDQASLVKLGGQLLLAGKAYDCDRQLADQIGPRLTGSPNYVKATDWAAEEFTRMGLLIDNGEFVLIGGHLDSWHLGTGAEDNGTGAATLMAVAEAVKASGLTPRRTMRFVLFGGEEEGLIGSLHYARDHVADMSKCAGVFVTDSGSEPPMGWMTFGREDQKQALTPIHPLLVSLG